MKKFVDFLQYEENVKSSLTNGFEELEVENIILDKEANICKIDVISKTIVLNERFDKLVLRVKQAICPPLKDIKVNLRIVGLEKKKPKDIIKKYWPNIFYMIKMQSPLLLAYGNDLEHLFIDNKLKIKTPDNLVYNMFLEKEIINKVKELVKKELSLDIEVELEVARNADHKDLEIEKLIEKRTGDIRNLVSKIYFSNLEEEEFGDKEEKYVVNIEKTIDPDIIYGVTVEAFNKDMKDVDEFSRTVAVTGQVINVDSRANKYGKINHNFQMSDRTGAISCRVILNDLNAEKVIKETSVGKYICVRGDVIRSKYTGDIELNVTGIKIAKPHMRMDLSDEKRVELHAHTQMSSMDAIIPVKELIKRAETWGHKAIAITDHGVVQGFPDAMNASKGKDIKVIYGVEAYLVDDDQDLILNANKKDLNQRFVVFDLETTGFSPTNDNITEIGAVLIENGKIIEEFSSFVDPQMDISYKIQDLTGITNDMVKDAPKIDEILPKFMEFSKDAVFVAHNADFDTGFISQKCKEIGLEYKKDKVDTLSLSRILLSHMKKFTLDKICKELGVSLSGHHRAVNDARATAEVYIKFLDMFKKNGIETLAQINDYYGKVDYTKLRPTHATIYAKNYQGLKNLYRLISDSHIEHFYRSPRILKSKLKELREGLIVGSACSSGELYNAVQRNKSDEEIRDILDLYDFIEVMPLSNNSYLVDNGEVKDYEELININKKLIELGDRYEKLVVATGDVHILEPEDEIYRRILKYSQGFSKADKKEELYFRTTEEMMDEFYYLDPIKAYEIVIKNANKIADMIDDIVPIPKDTYPPVIEGSEEELRSMCYTKAKSIYGDPLPEVVQKRLDRELNSIIGNGYAVMYIIAHKLVAKSLSDGYLVGSRGSVGSSLAATMSDITEVNPLPAHYVCPNPECRHSEFFEIGEKGSGVDLPDKNCPKCGEKMIKDGHDIPFEVFLGFDGDKEPDIDLNFSGVYQPVIHKYTEELFGEGYTFRAGTIGTVKDKTAYGYVKKFSEEKYMDLSAAEKTKLTLGCTGVKRTSGQHPGGVMVIPNYKDVHDFTPIQYPANDKECGVITTHFDYHSISGRILKLDILGHDGPTIIRMLEDMTGIKITDIPLDDPETMSLFTSTKALGVTEEQIGTPVGSLAIPEFGTKFTRQMLIDTQPTTFAELGRISGLSHGTDVWVNNAQDLVRANVVGLKEVISTRDDIMNYLIFSGLEPKMAFTIMESVRKGKGLKPEHVAAMTANNVPEWYINSCKKIKYMFPKAHAVAYVMTSFRIAYCKVNYPEAFYATYFTTKVDDFDVELVTQGLEAVKSKMNRIYELGMDATTKEQSQLTVLEVVVEMLCRGIEILKVDIYKSHATEFKLAGEKKILPPMTSLQGMGENAAKNIVRERKNGRFLSKEDLIRRTKVSKTVVEKLSEHGSLDGMSEKNQLSFL
ncbi:PolC-type DNA polymerase III [Peptostreptococcus equinus]|uniref:DNA polymerase III PolC-type n=1 Tax=Peptostreptococcus equinus TaxID=3003601 RepID=A0ABY7JNU9_9FIRM|nr:PolC-type DNA polymerase III [Peptostreptococcus sp. CBA3647]WAW14146.1 PolC-type DNA polymerase III [Peptostreptococcus sp. CBA3647]